MVSGLYFIARACDLHTDACHSSAGGMIGGRGIGKGGMGSIGLSGVGPTGNNGRREAWANGESRTRPRNTAKKDFKLYLRSAASHRQWTLAVRSRTGAPGAYVVKIGRIRVTRHPKLVAGPHQIAYTLGNVTPHHSWIRLAASRDGGCSGQAKGASLRRPHLPSPVQPDGYCAATTLPRRNISLTV